MYNTLILDSDTFLVRAAKAVQQDYVEIENKQTGVKREFPNQTEFWGHWKKKQGGWLAQTNSFIGTSVSADVFEVEECARLSPEIVDHLGEAERMFDIFVGSAKNLGLAEDYKLIIGGEENFRYEAAKLLPYKGQRKPKPLIFLELKQLIIEKYKSKIVVCDGIEADDYCSILGWENFKHYKSTGDWKYVLGYIDKDLDMIIGPHMNPDKPSEGVSVTSPIDAAKSFATQLLTGDVLTDNIQGLPNFTDEFRVKYSLRKTRGVGRASADALLKDCSPREMFRRVAEAWRAYYGEEKRIVIGHTGEELQWNWLDYLQDSARLLYLLREHGEEYHITTTLKRFGIGYT